MAQAEEGGAPGHDGWERLKALGAYVFSKHDPSAQLPPMPEELRTWAQDTVLASGVGLAVGGTRQWAEERRAGPVQAPAGAASKAHAARAMAEAQTERLVRVMNASLKAGLRVGGLAAVFYAAEALSGIYRGRRDFYDTAVGGMTAGTLFGVAVARGGGQRGGPALLLRSAVLGAALGAAAGVPVGLLQDKLVSLMPEKARQQRRQRHEQTEAIIRGDVKHDMPVSRNYDVTAAVIEQLEASLARSPTQQAAVAVTQQAAAAAAGGTGAHGSGGAGGGGEDSSGEAGGRLEDGGSGGRRWRWWR